MKFYTWCNNSKSDKIQRLLNSAKLQNIEIEIIGGGRDIHEGGNYNGKNLWLYEKVCELDENEIVVCTDSFDVIYLTNADEIKQKFLKMNTPIVYSTEYRYQHQILELQRVFDEMANNKHFKYMCAGVMMGYAKNIKEMFEIIFTYDYSNHDEVDDQKFIGKYICENSDKVKLDYDCEIFWTDQNFNNPPPINKVTHPKYLEIGINELKQKILKNGRMYNTITDNYPCIFHCPYVRHTHKLISTAWDYIKTTK